MSEPTPEVLRNRRRVANGMVGVAIALFAWAVLYMNFSALGMPPAERSFSHRKPYTQIKRSIHEAFPGFLLRAAAGGLFLMAGLRLRKHVARALPPSAK